MWDEYKELKMANTVKNVIRHILEYYFIQICGYEGNDLHKIVSEQNKPLFVDEVEGQKPNYDRYNIASSMFTYMNDSPVVISDGFNYIDDGSDFGLTEDKEKRLSEIIDEINSRTGKNYNNDVVVKAMLQIKDILMKSDKLKTSAKNNTQQDFEFSYFDDIDDALIEGLSQNQDFFSMLLSNDEMKRQVLGIFSEEIYKSLRESL